MDCKYDQILTYHLEFPKISLTKILGLWVSLTTRPEKADVWCGAGEETALTGIRLAEMCGRAAAKHPAQTGTRGSSW